MLRVWLAATSVVAMMTGVAVAQTSSSAGPTAAQQPRVREPIMASPGWAFVPRYLGSMGPIATPGSGDQGLPLYTEHPGSIAPITNFGSGNQGLSMEDGNATRMVIPGQPPNLMSTPE